MEIKMLKTAMVGKAVARKGSVVDAADDEGKALVTAGYAKQTKASAKSADYTDLLDGTVAQVTERLATVDKAELTAIAKAEKAGKDRVGVHDAIAAAQAAE